MRFGVIGAGALGGTFAALLEKAGHEVQVTARGSGLAAILSDGIRLSGGFGDAHAHPLAAERLSGGFDLVLVCTKAQDAAAAIAANARVIDGTPIVVVQNGLEGVETVRGLLPNSEVFGALSIIAANYTEPGVVRVTTKAASYLGRGSGSPDAACMHWASVLSEAVPFVAVANFVGAQWTKLIVNMLNGLPAITGLSVQQVIADRGLRRALTASMREAIRVGEARGIRFGTLQGLGNRRLRLIARAPLWLGQALPLLMGARMGSVPNLGSTQQSIRRGAVTEVDYLNGAIVREAAAVGLRAPVNERITALVHEVERGEGFLPVQRVVREVLDAR
ncbi:ketopantoate reductase family protein [Rathayibacter sp. YIM 133350]|uniref:ketopantoate reductase family protein n=1 Tax=Rathayibacter sp. YIM 133350 TaxID=3131992 RepID=UPI00307D1E24